ncbi:MAG: ATP-binding protein [Opitutae bacterium]
MSQWDLLSELFTVLIEISEDGETRRVSPFVKVRLDSRDQHDFRFFEDFQFKRPARFRGGPLEALATPGRLFLAFSDPLQLAVRGQIIPSDSEAGGGLFVGVPWLAWMSEKYPESEPQFDDFPVHDSQMDQLLLLSTQQKMLEDLQGLNSDLESAKREVEGQGEVRQQFFNRVSHEVRTPLMGVSSALTLLSDKIEDQQALDLLSMAEASMDRATEVIKEGSRAEQFKVATDLRHLGKSLRKLFLATATEKGLTLSVSVSDDIHAQYWCADLLLKEVLINLLGNAIKFTSKGSVHLKVALSKSSAEAVHEVMFQVADSGPGIPEGLRRQVFSPFETGVSAATQGHIGTG